MDTVRKSMLKNLELLADIFINTEKQNKFLQFVTIVVQEKEIPCFIIKKQLIFLMPPVDIYFEKEVTFKYFVCQNDWIFIKYVILFHFFLLRFCLIYDK